MKICRKHDVLLLVTLLTAASLAVPACVSQNQGVRTNDQAPSGVPPHEARGRYLVIIAGCNDCHTRGFAQSEVTPPESDWLTGESVGWQGPWGTTYAINLRLFVQSISEEAWVKVSRIIRSLPPMPRWALRELTEPDLRAIHRFIRSLGPKGEAAPARLPPTEKPKTPYILHVPQVAK